MYVVFVLLVSIVTREAGTSLNVDTFLIKRGLPERELKFLKPSKHEGKTRDTTQLKAHRPDLRGSCESPACQRGELPLMGLAA